MFTLRRNRFLFNFRRCQFIGLVTVYGALAISAVGASSAWAQYGTGMIPVVPRTNRNNQNQNSTSTRGTQPFQGTATITAVGALGLEVTDSNGNKWKLAPEKNCVIEVTGTADPSFLKPDMLVKFTAQFDKKGKATAPVNELEIISPQAAMGSLKSEVTGKKETLDGSSGLIIGHIKSVKNNLLTVQTPSGTYTADMGTNPSIKVNVSDFRLAQPGDKVDAKGIYSQQGLAAADEMKISLSTPLGDGSKKKPAATNK